MSKRHYIKFEKIEHDKVAARSLLWFYSLMLSYVLGANNLRIGPSVLTINDEFVFTVADDNSWYTHSPHHNRDEMYLIVKYRNCTSTNAWNHAILTNNILNSVDSPWVIDN